MAWYEEEEVITTPGGNTEESVTPDPVEPEKPTDPVPEEPELPTVPEEPTVPDDNTDPGFGQEDALSAFVRILLGNVSPEVLPPETLALFVEMAAMKYDLENHPERLPNVKYDAMVQAVRWMMVQEVASGESSISSRLEKIGDETIEVRVGQTTWQGWRDFLDWLVANPDYVDSELDACGRLVIIGGVRNDEFQRVKRHRNSVCGFDVAGITPMSGLPSQPKRYPSRR
nr:MAG TPA: hypothetical protein [Caudoviricetes sp.]